MMRSTLTLFALVALAAYTHAFAPRSSFAMSRTMASAPQSARFMSDDFADESNEATQEQIQALVENHPILLFMKGSKLFPQCGFSNTAIQILNSYDVDYHTVDVLSDQNIRQGVKEFSQWPTIPQLYVAGEFIGGSDIMIELYQTGELGEMIEKAKAEMM